MHMSDALVSPAIGGVMWAATAGLAAYSLRTIARENDNRAVPLMGVTGAFVFAAQMLNFAVPGTGSSGHLGGGLLLAILLGPCRGFLSMAAVLLIQALFFADGGLLAYGCNVFNLGFFPCFVIYPLVYRPLAGGRTEGWRVVAASLAGAVLGLQLGSLGVVVETILSGVTNLPFGSFLLLMQPIHLAIGVVEGLATAAVAGYVLKTRPDLLYCAGPSAGSPVFSRKTVLVSLLAAAVIAGCFLSWFASPDPDGLEWALEKAGAETAGEHPGGVHASLAGIQEATAILPDYDFRSEEESVGETDAWPAVTAGGSVSGLVGGALTMGLVIVIGLAASRLGRRRADSVGS